MAGNTDPHGFHARGMKHPVETPLVVGIDIGLGSIGRLGPIVHRRVDPLHGEVGALHQANLHLSHTRCVALTGPFDQSDHRIERLRYVGLKHNAGVEAPEVGLVEKLGERPNGDLQIVVLLHVEVDERGRLAGRGVGVDLAKAVLHVGQRVVECPEIDLRRDPRNLDRYVIHIGLVDELEG